MARIWATAGAVSLLAILIASVAVFWHLGLGFNSCQADERVSRSDRATAESASFAFIDLMRAGETNAVLESMSDVGQQAAQRVSILNIVEMIVQSPGDQPVVRSTYSLWSFASGRGFARCNTPRGVAFVARGGGLHSLFTIVSEPIVGGERYWTFWLEHDRGAWRVRGVHVGLGVVAGRDGADFWALAEQQRRENQVFNSTLLYDLANTALYRGGFLQPPEAAGFAEARRRWRRHQDVIQSRFYVGGGVFPIASMNALGTRDAELVLVLDQHLDLPVTTSEAIVRNRALIDAMNADRPEWAQVFDALAVGAPTGPNRLWRTVYERESGYLEEVTPAE